MRRFRKIFRKESGFTLIELLVVIAVLGILSSIAIPRLTGVKNKAYLAEAQSGLGAFKTSLEMYYVEHESYPTNDTEFDTMAESYIDGYDGTVGDGTDIETPNGTWEEWNVLYNGDGGEDFTVTLGKDLDGENGIEDSEKAVLTHNANGYSVNQ